MLDRLKGEGSGLVGEAVQQGLLQREVGRVQRLEDVRLKTVARVTFESFSYGYNQGRYKKFLLRTTILVMCLTGRLNQ